MKSIIIFLICLICFPQLNAQFCNIDSRFSEKEYFSDSQISSIKDIKYASAKNKSGIIQDLHLDIYYPHSNDDELTHRPFILLIHGGGFETGTKESFDYECSLFAKRGYVVATIEYRLGEPTDDQIERILRIYRADQDAQAAMRWVVANANNYGIDTSWIFAGGISAGSVMSHDLIYLQQSDWDATFSFVSATLGNLYTSGNTLTDHFSIKGLYNNCGSIFGPGVKTYEMVPTIAFHKTYDHLVPIDTSSSTGSYGSRVMHNWLKDEGVCTELTIDTNYYNPSSGASHCPFFDLTGIQTRVNRASCFFKSVMCSRCISASMDDILNSTCSEYLSTKESNKNELVAFPNPSSGIVKLPTSSEWTLYNTQQTQLQNGKGSQINIAMYPEGVYFLHLGEHVVKLIKQ